LIVKRKLPSTTGQYRGPEFAESVIDMNPTKYALWACVEQAEPGAPIVRLARLQTFEVPGSKWVEFATAPTALLLNGSFLYPSYPEPKEVKLRCEWSDFLRITRWRKQVEGLPPHEQALIALVRKNSDVPVPAFDYALVANDHPIRRSQ
jgi:hypothetical protein